MLVLVEKTNQKNQRKKQPINWNGKTKLIYLTQNQINQSSFIGSGGGGGFLYFYYCHSDLYAADGNERNRWDGGWSEQAFIISLYDTFCVCVCVCVLLFNVFS